MPLSKEAKKAYNQAYYLRNKERINANRLISLIQNDKQKGIREQTVEKYQTKFTEEQMKFIEKRIIKKDPFLVSPAPVAQDEQGPAPTPVAQNEEGPVPNRNVFSLDQARELIDDKANSAGSKRTYKSRLNPLMKLLVGSENETDFSLIFKRNTIDAILKKILKKYKKTPSAYIQALLFILERSPELQKIVDSDSILTRLRKELRTHSDREKVNRRDNAKTDETDYELIYRKLFEIERTLAKKENGSQDHLIAAMYSRGVYGNTKKDLRIISRNYFWKLWLVRDDKEFKKGENSLNINSGRLFIDDYKTVKKYGQIDVVLNTYVKKLIQKSYQADPRQYLFTNTKGQPYKDSNQFLKRLTTVLGGVGIDLFRKAIINHELDNGRPRDELARTAAHSVETNELIYQSRKKNT